jgi:hypothetical protein
LERGWSTVDLVDHTLVGVRTVARHELGETVSDLSLGRIARALGVPVAVLRER